MAGHNRIFQDYFAEVPVYSDFHFRRRFRMRKALFLRILEKVIAHDSFFLQLVDAAGLVGLSSIQKITAALRMLAYGSAADQLDEYIRLGESTALMCLNRFCKAIVDLFTSEYLRSPTLEDTERILAFNQSRGFPGMIGSIDCMHWDWKNCPRGWAGAFQGKAGHPTIVLEAIASYDLWIWHAFFGMPGSLNDLNVLARSPVFSEQIEGVALKVSFRVNGNEYTQTYVYLLMAFTQSGQPLSNRSKNLKDRSESIFQLCKNHVAKTSSAALVSYSSSGRSFVNRLEIGANTLCN